MASRGAAAALRVLRGGDGATAVHGARWFRASAVHREAAGRPAGASSGSRGSRQPRREPLSQSAPSVDFLLGLSVRRNTAGYALLRFEDLLPLQFGLVDVRKAVEVQQKALEIAALLRDLRITAPKKLEEVAADQELGREEADEEGDDDDDDEEDYGAPARRQGAAPRGRPPAGPSRPPKSWRWIVGIDDAMADRSLPGDSAQQHAQRSTAMLQGLIIGDCKRLFRAAPVLIVPQQARQSLGVYGRGPEARRKVFDIACGRISDFPVIKAEKSGAVKDESLLLSDAWASARFAQRMALIAQLKSDAGIMEELRREALKTPKLRRLSETAADLHPRKPGRDLEEVLASQTEYFVEKLLNRMLDAEEQDGGLRGQSLASRLLADRKGGGAAAARR